MVRWLGVSLLSLFLSAAAGAHFVFVVPQPGGTQALVIFSEDLEPDDAVDVAKIGGTKLFVRDAAGKVSPLKMEKAEHAYKTTVPGSGSRMVYGTTDYGVLQRGDSKPFRLVYHPKTLLGGTESAKLGEEAVVEIVPVGPAGKLRLLVLSKGKPVAEAEINLILPDGKKQKVVTDKEGLSPVLEHKGRIGAWARFVEARAGEADGKKFEETRHYASLVVDAGEAGK